ncbi:hypothetical protein BDV11DRAFT_123410 [Aspergillus similis]
MPSTITVQSIDILDILDRAANHLAHSIGGTPLFASIMSVNNTEDSRNNLLRYINSHYCETATAGMRIPAISTREIPPAGRCSPKSGSGPPRAFLIISRVSFVYSRAAIHRPSPGQPSPSPSLSVSVRATTTLDDDYRRLHLLAHIVSPSHAPGSTGAWQIHPFINVHGFLVQSFALHASD